MPTVLLTHTPDMLANYYGPRALAALRALCDVRFNETGAVLDNPAALARAARGCEIIVSDRQTPLPPNSSPRRPVNWRRSCASPSTSAISTCRRRANWEFW